MNVTVAGQPGVLTVGHGPDGAPRRIELRAGVHGSFVAGSADALATAITVVLQHGVPAAAFTDALRHAGLGAPDEDDTNLLVDMCTAAEPAGLVAAANR
ncbi:hypothetical protein AB0K00_40325 [Dactylosporangium sp. NPDC049525]|uniref:hypothetical protein n=1 Tax=Dactylosporangium sp. NPDC049525 TaxID=3154730 RepID=UPI00343E2AF1